VASVAVGYVLFQSAARVGFAITGLHPWKFTSAAAYLRFAALSAAVGACVGAGVFGARRLSNARGRAWAEVSLRLTALVFLLSSWMADMGWVWIFTVVLVSAVMARWRGGSPAPSARAATRSPPEARRGGPVDAPRPPTGRSRRPSARTTQAWFFPMGSIRPFHSARSGEP
jgi:hypothetical protein